jgi:hypothetical protein
METRLAEIGENRIEQIQIILAQISITGLRRTTRAG